MIGKLGKKPARMDVRTLRLDFYIRNLPPAPPACDYTRGITQWGMMANDRLGCCTIAAVGHAIQTWHANLNGASSLPEFSDSEIIEYYSKWDDYVPGDPATDQGGIELDVLSDWRAQSFCGHNLKAFCAPDPKNREHVRQAVLLFGGLYIGLQLPNSCFQQEVWDAVQDDGGIAGGHAVWCPAYDETGITCITWGELKKMTWAFWEQYCDESHCLMSDTDWNNPAGVDYVSLASDLEIVTA